MPSVAVPSRLAQRLADLHAAAQQAGFVALQRASQAGAILAPLTRAERAALIEEAGISERTAYNYLKIHAKWPVIEARLQHAAKPSLRAALKLAGGGRRKPRKAETYKLRLDHVGAPEQLGRLLASVRGRSVDLTLRVQPEVQVEDPRQPWLPFD